MPFARLFLLAALAVPPSLHADPDVGGVSFDFAALSEAAHPDGALGPNLVPAGEWQVGKPHIWAYPADIPEDAPERARVRETKALSFTEKDGWHSLAHAASLARDAGSKKTASLVGTRATRTFAFAGEPGDYLLEVEYRHVSVYCHGARVTAFRLEAKDASGGVLLTESLRLETSGIAHRARRKITLPSGVATIVLTCDLNGVGMLRFREPTLRRAPRVKAEIPPIVLRNAVPHNLDGVFCLSEGQCGAFTLEWKEGTRAGKDLDFAKVRLHFELPACVTCAGSTAMDSARTIVTTNANGSTTLSVALRPEACLKPSKEFNRYGRPFIFLLTAASRAGAAGKGSVVVELDGEAISNREEIRFEIIPRITAVRPRRYLPGLIAGTDVFAYGDAASEEAMAGFAADCGVRWVIGACSEAIREILRAKGVTYVSGVSENFRDGYVIGPESGIPASDRFVPAEGLENRRPYTISVCPISVYTESEHFRTKSLPLLEKQVRGYDGLWVNWELWEYGKKGCFCERCRAAFAKFCGVSEGEVAAIWPAKVQCDGEWGEKYIRFRSEESAKVVRTLDKYVRRFCRGGAQSPGFMPGVAIMQGSLSWQREFLDEGLTGRGFAEADVHAWARDIRTLHLWGPYPWWSTGTRWTMARAAEGAGEVAYFTMAKDVRASLDRLYGRKNRLLTGAPQGLQGDVNVTEPEAIALALDSQFFNGWDASTIYFFPRGYDARYWRAFAASATRAAKYEDAVYDGTRCDDAVMLEPQAGYPAPVPKPSEYLPDTKGSFLQHAAYDYRGVRYVAALNFSWHVAAQAVLKTDFAGGDYEIVDENGRTWSKDARLTVPAARTRVFELRARQTGK